MTLCEHPGNFCAVTVRKVRRKVIVVDATAHCCVGEGPTVGGLNDLWVCHCLHMM